MQSKALTVTDYINELPLDKKEVVLKLRDIILRNLPDGFTEEMNYGMIGYVVPHALYPAGYHCNPKQPLPFINLASQKNFIALYHMGLYADSELLSWFTGEYVKYSGMKPDMGKSCIRLKKTANIPYDVVGLLASKMDPQQWIELYERQFKR